MGILDKVTALLPWRSERHERPPGRAGALALRDDLDRWLQQVLDDSWGHRGTSEFRWAPAVSMRETDDELVVIAEVPGLDRDDLDLTITPNGLTIRGEKREEKEDTRKGVYLSESRYGNFVRTVPLPPGLDVDRATAQVKRGVLTVKFPKVAAGPGARRVPIRT
jgi:HSP20 family protein